MREVNRFIRFIHDHSTAYGRLNGGSMTTEQISTLHSRVAG
jgi:hypothetical protein